jgi:hypothetical protein
MPIADSCTAANCISIRSPDPRAQEEPAQFRNQAPFRNQTFRDFGHIGAMGRCGKRRAAANENGREHTATNAAKGIIMITKAMKTETKNESCVLDDAALDAVTGGSISDTIGAVSSAIGKVLEKAVDAIVPDPSGYCSWPTTPCKTPGPQPL